MSKFVYYLCAFVVAVTVVCAIPISIWFGTLAFNWLLFDGKFSYHREQIDVTQAAWSQVEDAQLVGKSQREVHAAMNEIAWRHYDCPNRAQRDIYLIGSVDSYYVGLLMVNYDLAASPIIVERLSSWDLMGEGRHYEEFIYGCQIAESDN